MPSERWFTSPEPLSGDPPSRWQDFRHPRLRRFPEPAERLQLQGRPLGCGIDGLVCRARIPGYAEPLVAKIFHFADRPPPVYGATRYWAFERECINRALLDMVTTSFGRATAAGRQIYVRPGPATMAHARDNLRAFCDEAATRPQPAGFVPFESTTEPVGCLGWIELQGSTINDHFRKARVDDQEFKDANQMYPAIVYRFVEGGTPDLDVIDAQVDFFHLVGFIVHRFNERNWLGKGVLVDFSDLVPHHTGHDWWRPVYYAQQGRGFYRGSAERAIRKGLLGPRAAPLQESPPLLPGHHLGRASNTRQGPGGGFQQAMYRHPNGDEETSTELELVDKEEASEPISEPDVVQHKEGVSLPGGSRETQNHLCRGAVR